MRHPLATVELALVMHGDGVSALQIARHLGVSRGTVRYWIANPSVGATRRVAEAHELGSCGLVASAPPSAYAYLLGQYLGDGCISAAARGVYKLRIMTCDAYPGIRQRTIDAIAAVMPRNRVGTLQRVGCSEVWCCSKHWPCLFPQHAPGKKHDRRNVLADWQQRVVDACPREFLTGLIHSDGNRCTNTIRKRGKEYRYPRYFFTNTSGDIRNLFCTTCDALGVAWRQNNWNNISIARAADVAFLDQFVGPKT